MRDPAKVAEFMKWLERQVDKGLLSTGEFQQVGQGIENVWTNRYILDSYKRGVMRARYELEKAGYNVPSMFDIGFVLGMPMHLDRIGLLYTRVYSQLKGITDQMSTQISQVLAQGMIDGTGMRELARKLTAVVDGQGAGAMGITDTLGRFIPARRRALTLVRTEITRAHHLGMVQEYKNWRVEGVYVLAEWVTAGDDRVCTECEKMEGKRFTLEEIEGMIPAHPNCRCIAMPYLAELEPYYTRK
jgi:SPP1 gp7 family putative phage head morphogenesis protein